jgi:hypothetical protein
MPPIGRGAVLTGEEVEPLVLRDVERSRQRLQSTGREHPDVLLDVLATERIANLDVVLMRETRRRHPQALAARDERTIRRRRRAKLLACVGRHHRGMMQRRLPRAHDVRMARRAGIGTQMIRRVRDRRRGGRPIFPAARA